jgi:hypothetical protein
LKIVKVNEVINPANNSDILLSPEKITLMLFNEQWLLNPQYLCVAGLNINGVQRKMY